MKNKSDIIVTTLDAWNEFDPVVLRREASYNVFYKFILDTYPVVTKLDIHDIPSTSEKFAVIIEPRPHPLLDYVLRNIMFFLGPEWGLQIFVGNENEEFVQQIVNGWGAVHVDNLGVDNLDREEFRDLRKSAEYWERMQGEYLLCFETDTLLCRRGIDDFLQYDYVGAPWAEHQSFNPEVRVGNGGLSLRRKSVMIDICRTSKGWVIPSEDSFFSINLQLRKTEFNLPGVEEAQRFSVESMFYSSPLGIHKPWGYLTEDEMGVILGSIDYKIDDFEKIVNK